MVKKLLIAILLLIPLSAAGQLRELPDFTGLAEKQGAAVVNISTISQARQPRAGYPAVPNLPEDDPFYEFFRKYGPGGEGAPRDFESKSLGSGFIISADGYVLTNAHVVAMADEITVKLVDKREFKAKVIGADRRTDIALIKIDGSDLPRLNFGDPSELKVGEWVIAIGSPFGFENTMTAGIVSAKGRALPQDSFVPFIQTDVAVNPGNSGGPLLNLRGEVVGINSQIYSRTGGFMGLSFAIPIDVAVDVSNQLRTSGRVRRGRIGVVIQDVTKELAQSFGLRVPEGALVNSVESGSPGEKAGLAASDIILAFDGKPVATSGDLPRVVGATKPGSRVPVQIWRKGKTRKLSVLVGEIPDERVEKLALRKPVVPEAAPPAATMLGMTLAELPEALRAATSVGVLVEDAQGAAARAGIRRGDILIAINDQDVKSADQFAALVKGYEKGRSIALLIQRGGSSTYIPLKIAE